MRKPKNLTKTEKLFSVNLRQYREAASLSQEELSEKVGIQAQQLSRLERGVNSPKIDTLINLARALNLPIETLLGVKSKHTSSDTSINQVVKIIETATKQQERIIVKVAKAVIESFK